MEYYSAKVINSVKYLQVSTSFYTEKGTQFNTEWKKLNFEHKRGKTP